MSIAALTLGELPIAAQPAETTTTRKPPRRRQTIAKADTVAQPEAR